MNIRKSQKQLTVFFISLLIATVVQSHVRQREYISSGESKGRESIVHWDFSKNVKISMHEFSGVLSQSSSIDVTTARSIIGASIAQWSKSYFGVLPAIQLSLDGGLPHLVANNCERDAANSSSKLDGVNNLIFSSKISATCADLIPANNGIIGLTKARSSASTGEIVEADIQFDDRAFRFVESGSNDIASDAEPKIVNLYDAVTHEFGHLLGLDHSASRTAAMLFAVADDLHTTKDDDLSGILSLYPASTMTSLSRLQGSLTKTNGSPVFGALVYLLDARTLQVSSSDFSDANGAFDFCAVKPGPHVVFSNRYTPFGTNLHKYYTGEDGKGSSGSSSGKCVNPTCGFMDQTLTHNFYGQSPSGTFQEGGLSMNVVQLNAGTTEKYLNLVGSVEAQDFEDVPGDASVSSLYSYLDLDSPRVALLSSSALERTANSAKVGWDAYRFTLPSAQELRISTASLSLYARLNLELELYSSTNMAADLSTSTSFCSGNRTATINLAQDPSLICNLAAGSYVLKVTGSTVSCTLIPGNAPNCESASVGETASTSKALYMVTVVEESKVGASSGTGSGMEVALASTSSAGTEYSNLPTCELMSKDTDRDDSGACCGTLNQVSGGPENLDTFLLSLFLNPLLFFALYWSARGFLHQRRFRGHFASQPTI